MVLAEQRRNTRPVGGVPQLLGQGLVRQPFNVQCVCTALRQKCLAGFAVLGGGQVDFTALPRCADGHDERFRYGGAHLGQSRRPILPGQRVQAQLHQVSGVGTLRSGGLGGQLRQSAGKQRDDNFGSFGVQFDHKALLLLAAILCLHFTTFLGFCTTAFACDTRRPALQ